MFDILIQQAIDIIWVNGLDPNYPRANGSSLSRCMDPLN
jgi:hypothetical protein